MAARRRAARGCVIAPFVFSRFLAGNRLLLAAAPLARDAAT
jgi:hypothetical protein